MSLREFFNVEPETLLILGFSIFFFGVFVCFLGFENSLGWGAIVISIAIAFIVGGISKKSGIMTRDIAYSSFKETVGEFEDRRLVLRDKMYRINFEKKKDKKKKVKDYIGTIEEERDINDFNRYLSFSIWKCKTYLDRAMIYKKYLRKNDEEGLIHQVDCLYIELCDGVVLGLLMLSNEYLKHLAQMYDVISKFERFNGDSINDQFRRERLLNNLKFLKRLTNRIIDFKLCKIIPIVFKQS